MAQDIPPKTGKTKAELREERLKAALKSNMGRRKAQTRARRVDTKDNNASEGANEESS
jgi:hypothetical protein